MRSAPRVPWWRRWRMQRTWLSLKDILVLANPSFERQLPQTTSTWKCRRPLSGNNSAILSYSPLLQWPSRYFVDLVSLFMKRSLLVLLSFDQLSNFSSAHTRAQFVVSIGNEEEGIGTGFQCWLTGMRMESQLLALSDYNFWRDSLRSKSFNRLHFKYFSNLPNQILLSPAEAL